MDKKGIDKKEGTVYTSTQMSMSLEATNSQAQRHGDGFPIVIAQKKALSRPVYWTPAV